MNEPFQEYDYILPQELIAQHPLDKRDESRLFVISTSENTKLHSQFKHIVDIIPANALLIRNITQVVPAKVQFVKDTGGLVQGLVLVNELIAEGRIKVIVEGQALPLGRKVGIGVLSSPAKLHEPIDQIAARFTGEWFTVAAQEERKFILESDNLLSVEQIIGLLNVYGALPLPRYITEAKEEEKSHYITTFGTENGSVAAPTASLHFTDELFALLKNRGVQIADIVLHVGQGTFAPITPEIITSGKLHSEPYEIPFETIKLIQQAKKDKRTIIAIGTTVTRTLESVGDNIFIASQSIKGTTNLFIRPGFEFKVVDQLITNFHVPKSSLMSLVDAFLQYKKSPVSILDLYHEAIKQKYRFYSFGDAMYIQ